MKINYDMLTKYEFTLFLVSVFTFSQFYISNAYAYIDPGTGSAIFAIIIGLIAGVGMTLKFYWIKLKQKLSRKTN